MGKPSQSIGFSDRANGLLDRCIKRFATTRSYTSQHSLYLRPAFLYRRQVRRVRRQVDQLCASRFYRFSYPADFVRTQIVHHYNVSSLKCRAQHPLDINFEDQSIRSSIYGHQRTEAACAQAGAS
jgi:hypothetical protein